MWPRLGLQIGWPANDPGTRDLNLHHAGGAVNVKSICIKHLESPRIVWGKAMRRGRLARATQAQPSVLAQGVEMDLGEAFLRQSHVVG